MFNLKFQIERAQVLVDERGNSLREGIVEFARKPMALLAYKRCTEGCFFITRYKIITLLGENEL